MHRHSKQALLAIPVILAVGAGLSWAGSQGSIEVAGWPLFAVCGAISFLLNWIVFVPSYAAQTERFFDLTGSLTYLILVAVALTYGPGDSRGVLLAGLVALWALRLGSFLFARVLKDGSDGRFDRIKTDFLRFLMTWTLQGLWVFLTLSCALAALTADSAVSALATLASSKESGAGLDLFAWIGFAFWLIGFALEVTADTQKRRFRSNPDNDGGFITSGVWAWSRHPNYFGEIMLWLGVAIIALPSLEGWRYATLISPIFVYILLTRISGIPLLAARGKKRWGGDPAYEAYLARTPVLFPRPPGN